MWSKLSKWFGFHRRPRRPHRAGTVRTGKRWHLVLEKLEDRMSLTVGTTGLPDWFEQGPGPITNIPNVLNIRPNVIDPASGAVNALAPHPTNANILFAAAVNGGIWRTTNATAVSPSWVPLTDRYPSLSMEDIAFSPVDTNVLYAGTGRVSSFDLEGGPTIGLLKTTDGGDTWTVLGQSTFSGQNIVKVVPTALGGGQVVLVGSSTGVYRSVDGGVNWTLTSGTSGLPAGGTSDLVRDPTNINRFYVAVPGATQRVFRTDDGGLNWAAATLPPAGVGRIRLSVGAGGVVYAASMGTQLTHVFQSTNGGALWADIGIPSPTIHPGNQAFFHFSMVADPNVTNTLYVGGDRQDFPFSNGCRSFSGNHFRGGAGVGWISIDCNGARGGGIPTSPHPDSRAMVFDANNNVLESDDGGIYRLVRDFAGNLRWVSVLGNIRPTELVSVAYDSVNHTLLGSAQDNGSPDQTAANSFTWTDVTGGDGGVAAADNATVTNGSIHYSSAQSLGGFHRRTLNNAGRLLSDVPVALGVSGTSPSRNLFQVEANAIICSTLGCHRGSIQDIQPYVLNNAVPARMLIGTDFLYESTDMGDHLTALGGLTNLGGGNWRPDNPVGTVHAMDYGGFDGGSSKPEVMWVGSGSELRLRPAGVFGGLPSVVTAYPGSTVVAVKMDPANWRVAYVLDSSGRVWRTTNQGGAGTWTNLTGNLPSLTPSLRTLEVVRSGGDVAVLVGGQGGVYRAVNPGGTATWLRFGRFGSNAVVLDLHFNKTDNVLITGTLGRGAWKVANATATLFQPPVLTINGAADEVIRLARDPNIPGILNVFENGALTFTTEVAAVQQVIVNAQVGAEKVFIEDTFAGMPVQVNGGAGADDIIIGNNLDNVRGLVTVNGSSGGFIELVLEDQLNTSSATYTIASDSVTRDGFGGVKYQTVQRLIVQGMTGGDVFNVNSTSALTFLGGSASRTTVDTYNIGNGNLALLRGEVTILGQPGLHLINLLDLFATAGQTYTVTSGTVTRTGTAAVHYSHDSTTVNTLTLIGGNSGNTFNVQSMDDSTRSVTINPGTGDRINVGNGNLDDLRGGVIVNGNRGTNDVVVNDNTTSSIANYAIASDPIRRSDSITRPGFGGLTYGSVQSVTLNGANTDSRYTIDATSVPTKLVGGAGVNEVIIGNGKLDNVRGLVTVNGSSGGFIELVLEDQLNTGSATYTIASDSVTRDGFGGVKYQTVQRLFVQGMTGGDVFNVNSTSVPTFVNGSSSSTSTDTYNIGNGNLDLLRGEVSAFGFSGLHLVKVNDQGATAGQTYTVTSGTLTRTGAALIHYSGGALTVHRLTLNAGNLGNTINVQTMDDSTRSVTINPGTGDRINVGNGNLDALRGSVTVNGNHGTNDVVVNDDTVSSSTNYAIASDAVIRPGFGGLTYSSIQSLTLNGASSDSRYTVDGTSVPTILVASLGTSDEFIIGNGDLTNVRGPVTVNGGNGFTELVLEDQLNTGSATYTIDNVAVRRNGFGGVKYQTVQRLIVQGMTGGDVFNVNSTSALTFLGGSASRTTVDTYNIGNGNLALLRADVTILGQSGLHLINVFDLFATAGQTFTVTSGTVTRTGAAPIHYSHDSTTVNTLTLVGGNSANTFNVRSMDDSTRSVTIRPGAAGDLINITNAANALDGIGSVSVQDIWAASTLTVDDSGFGGNDSYGITDSAIALGRSSAFHVEYPGIANLNFFGGSGSDRFFIDSTSVNTTVSGGAGGNVFYLASATQSLANLAGSLQVIGGGADALVFFDTANPNAETYTFDAAPSQLALTTVPVSVQFSGMASVYLETNGSSTVDDPSGTVLVDVPPP